MNRLFAKEDYFSHVTPYLDADTLCTDLGIFKKKIPEKTISQVKFLAIRYPTNKINLQHMSHIEYLDCVNYIDGINFVDVPNVKTLVISLSDIYSTNMNNLPLGLNLLLVKNCYKPDTKHKFNLLNLPCNLSKIYFEYYDEVEKGWLVENLKNCKFPFDCEIYVGNLQINHTLQKN